MDHAEKGGTPELLTSFASGKVSSCPFPHSEIEELKRGVVDYLRTEGFSLERHPEDRTDMPIDFRYLGLLLRASSDPEISLGDFSRGVRVGPEVRLPRLPALYQWKRKWRLLDQDDPTAYLESEIVGDPMWRQNYSSIEEHVSRVLAVLDGQSSRAQALKMSESEACLRYPHVVVAFLGAMRKEKPGGLISARVLFDGSNGIPVNRRIRIRHPERSPVASDLKRFTQEKARRGEQTFSLTAHVTEAHRQVPVDKGDWHLLGCQVEAGGDVYIDTVGTLGVASASYNWSRVAASVGRITQHISGRSATTWHQLVADDFHLEAGGCRYRAALISFFVLCATAGIPLSWGKTAGGDAVIWVGVELLHRTSHLGISERRSQWIISWAQKIVDSTSVNGAFEEGLGWVMFVAGALEYERPFLGPLYRFMSLHPRNSIRLVPAYVKFSCHTSRHRLGSVDTAPAQWKYIRGPRLQEWKHRQAKEVWHWWLTSGEEHGK